MPVQLAYSTRSKGNGSIAKSNRVFKRKYVCHIIKSKSDIAKEELAKLFNI